MNAHRERSFFLPRRGKQMQEQDNTFSADLSRRGVLMGAAAGGLVIAGGGAMLAPSANAQLQLVQVQQQHFMSTQRQQQLVQL